MGGPWGSMAKRLAPWGRGRAWWAPLFSTKLFSKKKKNESGQRPPAVCSASGRRKAEGWGRGMRMLRAFVAAARGVSSAIHRQAQCGCRGPMGGGRGPGSPR